MVVAMELNFPDVYFKLVIQIINSKIVLAIHICEINKWTKE